MSATKAPREGRFSLGALCVGFGVLCFVVGWIAPNHYEPWVSFHNEAPIFAALIAFAGAMACRPAAVLLPRTTLVLLGVPLLWVGVQTMLGTILYVGVGLVSALFIVGVLLAWWVGASGMLAVSDRRRLLVWAAAVLVLVSAVSCFLAVLQWLRMETNLNIYAVERPPGGRPSSNLAQPNLLGTLLIMGIVSTGLLLACKSIRRWQAVLLLVFLSFGLTATESRAGLLSALGVGVFLMYRAPILGLPWGRRAVLLWWMLLLVFWWVWGPLNEALLLQSAREMSANVDNVRVLLWRQMLSAIAQSPWWGYGWNQTPVAQKFGVAAVPGSWTTDYAHNIALDILAWVGLPLGVALLGLMAWWVCRTAWRLKDGTELLLFCATIPVLVHSLVEFPFAYAFFLFPVTCIFGALHAMQAPDSFRIRALHPLSTRVVLCSALVLYALVAGRMFVEYLAAEEDTRIMRFELRRVGQRPVDYAPPRLLLLNQLDEMLKMGRLQPTRDMSPQDIERMRKANLFLNWATLHLNYVLALALNGHPKEASKQLQVLRGLYGPVTYAQATAELVAQRDHRYPELAAVVIP